jgi:glycosyltransferase involved in cell wall biosynthesis
MRVTHIITRLIVGGAQENTVATVLGLRQRPDVQVALISGPTYGPEGSLESLVTAHPGLLTIVPTLIRPVSPWNDGRALRHLTKLLKSSLPEVVHTHSGKGGILGRLAARKAGVPVIIHHIHGPSFGPFQGRLANWVFTTAERYAAGVTTHFVCSANAMSRIYLAAGIGTPEMFTRVFSGFPIEPFLAARNEPALRAQLGFSAQDFIIGKISRLAPLKGHHDLLLALKDLLPRHPSARLLFVGDGSARTEIEAETRSLGLRDKVVFSGLVSPAQVPACVGIMDCVAHLSYREALSRALPQGLAAAKPIVAYDFDGADEVCLEGETGFIVRTGDISSVTNRLATLAADPQLRTRLGLRGQAMVREQFPVERMVDRLYELYVKLLRSSSSSSSRRV